MIELDPDEEDYIVRCPICGSEQFFFVKNVNDDVIERCGICGWQGDETEFQNED